MSLTIIPAKEMQLFTVMSVFTFVSTAAATECTVTETENQESFGVTAVSNHHHKVETEILINASPEKVWDTLVSADNDWSSSFRGIEGEIGDDSNVTVLWLMKNGQTTKFPLKLLNVEIGTQFGWSEEFPNAKGIFDNHIYRIERLSECQTLFIQTDTFTGVSKENPNVSTSAFAERMLPNYVKFNRELKNAAEALQ